MFLRAQAVVWSRRWPRLRAGPSETADVFTKWGRPHTHRTQGTQEGTHHVASGKCPRLSSPSVHTLSTPGSICDQ